jgi:GTPase SAR1 family protein
VGGQKTLRSYWRNYFEKTDALIWVVDATDRLRIEDCRDELHGLLQEEVRYSEVYLEREDLEREDMLTARGSGLREPVC